MSVIALRGFGWSSMVVCSKRGLLPGAGRGCWLVDHVDGALGAWRVAGAASGVVVGTVGVAEAKERAGVRRARPRIARRSIIG